ncbi:MAG TPA: hypothetical protein VKN14_10175 [Flavobacteriaceae bacterium]|nr:hypothetical protein [Flavobacteriaceae bacterium]
METKNLRRGNLVKNKHHQILYVSAIHQDKLDVTKDKKSGDYTTHSSKNILGIPLNTEWLEKLGFIGNTMDMWIALPLGNELELHIECVREGEFEHACLTQGRTGEGVPGKDYKFAYLRDLGYVHEAQNLFFWLTGKELYIDI